MVCCVTGERRLDLVRKDVEKLDVSGEGAGYDVLKFGGKRGDTNVIEMLWMLKKELWCRRGLLGYVGGIQVRLKLWVENSWVVQYEKVVRNRQTYSLMCQVFPGFYHSMGTNQPHHVTSMFLIFLSTPTVIVWTPQVREVKDGVSYLDIR
jgi:hypothetical protein